MVSPERRIFLGELTSQEVATAAYLLRRLFDLGRERLGACPAVFGDVKEDVLGAVELLLEIPGLVPALALVDVMLRAEEHTSELQSRSDIVCRLLLEKKKT